MAKEIKEDPVREKRIADEILVDTYNEEEEISGWYAYLEDKLTFSFMTRVMGRREISPLEKGDTVKVIGMASDKDCQHEMFVKIEWKARTLSVPLSQLEVIQGDDNTREAVEDWHYWVNRGYQF